MGDIARILARKITQHNITQKGHQRKVKTLLLVARGL